MKNLIRTLLFTSAVLAASIAFTDTPPPGTVKAKMYDGAGVLPVIVDASGSIQVNIKNTNAIPVQATISTAGLATSDGQASQTTVLNTISSKLTSPLAVVNTGGVSVTNTVSVNTGLSQGVTDAQLRATPVPISGTVSTGLSQPLTDAQIRATALPVSGPLTDAQIRASALPVSVSGGSTSALQTTGNSSLSSIDTKTPALGQALAAASTPVVLPAAQITALTPLSSVTANAGTNLNTSLLALDSTVAKDASLSTLNTSVNTLLKPASTLAAVTTVGTITNPVTVNSHNVTNAGTFAVQATGTVTANVGTTNGLALDATLTGGSQKAIARGGAKGSTTAADVTSTNVDTNTQALDVAVKALPSVTVGSSVLPTGAATETTLSSLNAKVTAVNTGAIAGTVTANAGTNLNTSALNLESTQSAISAKLPATLGQKTMANSMAVTIASDQSPIPITGSISSSNPSVSATGGAVPASASYIAANNSGNLTGLTSTSSGASKKPLDVAIYDGSGNQITSFGGGSQYVDGSAQATPTGTVSLGYDGTNVKAIKTDAGGEVQVDVISSVLPTGAASESTLSTINGKMPSLGQSTMSGSQPVTVASNQSAIPVVQPDSLITGQGTQTVVGNNILLASAGSGSTDVSGYRSASVQIVSTGTAGTFIFENSNDGTNFQAMSVFNSVLTTSTPIVTAITATSSQIIYTFPIRARYIRVRIATTITGGSLQAFTRLSQESWSPAVQAVGSSTAGNFLVTASGSLTSAGTVSTVSSVTSSQAAIPGIVADVASAAITTTTTTAAFTPTFGTSFSVVIPVTVVTGTTPTLDVRIEVSDDSGTNWVGIYDFPRITTTGIYRSPVLMLIGNRVRYVQTITGTTPSFTRAINRLQSSVSSNAYFRQLIDRTVNPNVLNSTTASLYVGISTNIQLVVNMAAGGTPPSFQLEGSDDNGVTWYSLAGALSATAGATVQGNGTSSMTTLIRARVSTAGSGSALGYVVIKSYYAD